MPQTAEEVHIPRRLRLIYFFNRKLRSLLNKNAPHKKAVQKTFTPGNGSGRRRFPGFWAWPGRRARRSCRRAPSPFSPADFPGRRRSGAPISFRPPSALRRSAAGEPGRRSARSRLTVPRSAGPPSPCPGRRSRGRRT